MHKVRESLFIVVVQVGAMKIYTYLAAVEARSGKMKDRMKLRFPPKLITMVINFQF
jgi:hypothetical protein